MNNFCIVTDSCCDLPRNYIEENNVPFVSLTCNFDDTEYVDDFGKSIDHRSFYNNMRNGIQPKTSQPSTKAFENMFRDVLEKGMDILYICVSKGLSGTINSANIARTYLLEEFPQAKIEIVDILTASLGEGLMVMKAIDMKNEGSTFEDIIKFLHENIQKLNTYITVNDLEPLRRGGRISASAAAIGKILNINPILTINDEVQVKAIGKIRGRKKAINKLCDIIKARIVNPENQIICISHGDCLEEAERIRNIISNELPIKKIIISNIGPVVGTYGGPGAIAVFFIGKERKHSLIF